MTTPRRHQHTPSTPTGKPTIARQLRHLGWPTRILLLLATGLVVVGVLGGTFAAEHRTTTEHDSLDAGDASTDGGSIGEGADGIAPPASQSETSESGEGGSLVPPLVAPLGLDAVGRPRSPWVPPSGSPSPPPSPQTDPRTDPAVGPPLIPQTPPDGIPKGDPDGTGQLDGAAAEDDAVLSPAARAVGISFLAAFAVGVASRVFLRLALVAAGVAVLLLLGLERTGVIDIHWSVLEAQSGGVAGWLASQTESMRAFLTGSLPSGAAAATGFVLGFRRR